LNLVSLQRVKTGFLTFRGINLEAWRLLILDLCQAQMLVTIFTNQLAKEFLFVFCGVTKILFIFVLDRLEF
jgi:hypothetical protein